MVELESFIASYIFSLAKIELPLRHRGLVLVTGFSEDDGDSNGSGKSSLTSKGILWTLYGRTPSGLRADTVINRHAPEGVEVFGEICFTSGAGRCIVKRGRRPRGLRFWVDDQEVTRKVERETQAEIDRAIGLTFEEFCGTRVFGQGLGAGVLAGTTGDQKSLLERLLPFDTVDLAVARMKSAIDSVQQDFLQANTEFGLKNEAVTVYRKQIEAYEQAQDELRATGPPVQREVVELQLKNLVDARESWLRVKVGDLQVLRQTPSGTCPTCKQQLPPEWEELREKATISYAHAEHALTEIDNQLSTFNDYKQQYLRLDAAVSVNGEHIQFAQVQMTKALEQVEEAAAAREIYRSEKALLEKWQPIIKSQVRLALLEYACPVLSELTNQNLALLRNPQIRMRCYVDRQGTRDELAMEVQSSSGGDGFDALSGGEQQMTAFAFGLALAELAQRTRGRLPDLLILDEPFSMLDARNSEAIVDYLVNHPPAATVLLVSNEEALKPLIPTTIKVVKSNGISTAAAA